MALTTNLTSYWRLESSSADTLGLNNGTDTSISYAAAKVGNGASFNGSSSKIVMADSASLSIVGSYSIGGWIYLTSAPTSGNIIAFITKTGAAETAGYGLDYLNSAGTFQIRAYHVNAGTFQIYNTTQTIPTGTWVHIIMTYDGSNQYLYYNGAIINSRACTTNPADNAENLNFGTNGPATGQWLNGAMDEIGIWSRALTAAEVSQLYNNGSGLVYPLIPSRGVLVGNTKYSTAGASFAFINNGNYLIVATNTNGGALTSVTYGGVSMTQLGTTVTNTGYGRSFQLWGLASPAAGSNTLTASGGGGIAGAYVGVVSFLNVATTNPVTGATTYDVNTTSPSVTVLSGGSNGLVVAGFLTQRLSSYGAGTTQALDIVGAAMYIVRSTGNVGTASNTLSAVNSSTFESSFIAVSLNATPISNFF